MHLLVILAFKCYSSLNLIKHTFRNGKSRAPLVSQDIQADTSVGVDVRVVDAGSEVDLGGLERVVGREMDGKEEDTAGIW